MATYAIGDIHGCYRTLEALLDDLRFDPAHDRLWLLGDLVNRGPDSLSVLRWAMALGDRVVAVLGNHDLHLVARAEGLAEPRPKDNLDQVLDAPDLDELVAWLRRRPLFHREGAFAMVHAGLLPAWTLAQAESLAREVEVRLGSAAGNRLIAAVREPPHPPWSANLPPFERQRLALAACTLVRTVTADGALFLRFAGPPATAPVGCFPWYTRANPREEGVTLLFGHWAALGLYRGPGVMGLDTGCAWGGQLTALCLEDGRLHQRDNVDGSPKR